MSGDVARVKAMLDAGEPVDQKGPFDWTPLEYAAIAGKIGTASLLLDRGADPNARGQFDLTPLHWAALKGRPEMVGLLARRGARPDARNAYGMTPLHSAADEDVTKALLAIGAPVAARDNLGMTPLHTARAPLVVKTLMENGGDMRLTSNDGLTPFDLGVVAALEPAGVSIQSRRAPARLRGMLGRGSITIRSVTEHPLEDFAITAESPACDVIELFPERIDRLDPGQVLPVIMTLFRHPGITEEEHPIFFRLTSGQREIGKFDLAVDTTKGLTLEDQGWQRLGKANIRPAPSRLQYLAYAAVPLLIAAAWLVARARRKAN